MASMIERLIHPRDRERAERDMIEKVREEKAAAAEERRKRYEHRPDAETLAAGLLGVRHGEKGAVTSMVWLLRDMKEENRKAARQAPTEAAWVVDAMLDDAERRLLDAVDAAAGRAGEIERKGA